MHNPKTGWMRYFDEGDFRSVPLLPDGWRDSTDHDDAAPSFSHDIAGVRVWILFKDHARRRAEGFGDAKTFLVQPQRVTEDGDQVESEVLLDTDDWRRVVRYVYLRAMRNRLDELHLLASGMHALYDESFEACHGNSMTGCGLNDWQPGDEGDMDWLPMSLDEWALQCAHGKHAFEAAMKRA